ncbi:MAG: hypothetical protein ACI9EW_002339 [Cellvibrionaceae bacterium]|jgi:hypothetical protein
MTPKAITIWHEILKSKDQSGLDTLLADDVVFHSPVVHTPQEGKFITTMYLTAAAHVLGGDKFHYVREVYGTNDAVLEFETEIDGILFNGVDMIRWNDDNQIVDFKVMVRPLKAINKLHQMMGAMLNSMKK